MQINETSADGLKREYKIVVPAGDIESKLMGRLSEIGQSVNVPGFRPGKAPIALLKKRYGDALRGEILEQTIQDATQQAMTEKGVRPATQPQVEVVTFEDGADLEYTLAVELLPDIEPTDFSKLSLERLAPDISDDEVAKSLDGIAEQRKEFAAADADHAAESGDQVKIDFVGRIDGEEFEGGKADDFELELGSNRFIPGFEDQLLGAKAGSKVDVKVSFPDDYPAEELKGKDAVFEVDVKETRTAQPVEIDDELAKSVGMDDLDALKANIRESLEREYSQFSRARIKRDLLDRLADMHDFDVPPGMVDQEFEGIWAQVEQAKNEDKLDEDDKGKSEDELRDSYRDIAIRRVRLGLLLAEVGRTASITVTQDDLNRAMSEQARRFPGQEAQLFEFYQKNPQALQELQAPIFEDKVVDYILELAEVTERKVGVEELLRDPDAVAEGSDED